jgi:hypothetical protein
MGREHEPSELPQIFAGNSAVVCGGLVARGLDFLHGSEEQRGERQHANAGRLCAAPDACKRRVDPETTGFPHLAGDKTEGPLRYIEPSRRRSLVAGEFFDQHAGAVRQAKGGAVDEANADLAIGGGLNDVTLADRIAKLDLNGDVTGSRKSARAGCRLDFADKKRPGR